MLVLTTQTELGQLFKLPVLIHHYMEHVDMDGDKSFMEFMKEHYVGNIEHADDIHNDHESLPFKTLDVNTGLTLIEPNIPDYEVSAVQLHASSEKNVIPNQMLHSSDCGNSIWQPPCLA
jgi:hypothetical protein